MARELREARAELKEHIEEHWCFNDEHRAELERVKAELGEQLEFERTRLADAVTSINKAIASRTWLADPDGGRGSYEWDDPRYRKEFGAALGEIREALEPLAKIAADWSNCPKSAEEVAAARVDLKAALAEARKDTARHQGSELRDLRAELECVKADAMIAHRWFAGHFGEVMNGRDFAVKCQMADRQLEEARDALRITEGLDNGVDDQSA